MRFRERESGENSKSFEMVRKRWSDFDYHEKGGESLDMVQKRNIEVLIEVLRKYEGKNVVVGTYGTALIPENKA